MNAKTKKIFYIVGIIALVLIILYFSANFFAKQKLNSAVEKLPDHIVLIYDSADIDIIQGNVRLLKPIFKMEGKTTGKTNLEVELDQLSIDNFGYWDFLVNDTISVEAINVVKPRLRYYKDNNAKANKGKTSNDKLLKKGILVKQLNIKDGSVKMISRQTDSTVLKTEGVNLVLSQISQAPESSNSQLSLMFEDISFQTENLVYSVGNFENLYVSNIDIDKLTSKFEEVKLETKFGQRELSEIIKTERDHFNVEIASMVINNQDVGYKKDSTFYFRSKKISLDQLNAEIYRDKLVADDKTQKAMYSEMLRKLNFDLGVDTLALKNAKIIYKEKTKPDNPAGTLVFENLNASISNLGNIYNKSKRLLVNVNADFMKTAPIIVDWSFDVSDQTDKFVFNADIGYLKVDELNQFTKPNERVKLEGELLQTYFTIGGNANVSQIDLKTDYEKLDIIMLKDDGNEKKGLLSGIVNLFVSKNSEDRKGDYRYGYAEDVQRDKTKSIFNFIWLNVRDGLKSAVTGSGKKED